jgi:hypothetical protein
LGRGRIRASRSAPLHAAAGELTKQTEAPDAVASVTPARPYVRLAQRRPVSRHDKIRGLSRQAGTEPQSWETGQMDSITYVGLDVHKTTIAVAVARRCAQGDRAARATRPAVEVLLRSWTLRLWPASVFNRAWARLHGGCAVASPDQSGGSDQNGPARMLARLHRAGELTEVWVPDAAHEAMRDLVRARATAMKVLSKARQQHWWIPPATREGLFWRPDLDPSLSTLVDDGAL